MNKTIKLNPIMMLIISMLLISMLLIWAVIGISHFCVTNRATNVTSIESTMQWEEDTCWSGWSN